MFGKSRVTYIGDALFDIGRHAIIRSGLVTEYIGHSAQVIVPDGYEAKAVNFEAFENMGAEKVLYSNITPVVARGYVTENSTEPIYPEFGTPVKK